MAAHTIRTPNLITALAFEICETCAQRSRMLVMNLDCSRHVKQRERLAVVLLFSWSHRIREEAADKLKDGHWRRGAITPA
jgi:hypothetical protein